MLLMPLQGGNWFKFEVVLIEIRDRRDYFQSKSMKIMEINTFKNLKWFEKDLLNRALLKTCFSLYECLYDQGTTMGLPENYLNILLKLFWNLRFG